MPDENNNNLLPMFKIGQKVTWSENISVKGDTFTSELAGYVSEIVIKKEHLHLKYEEPSFTYRIYTNLDRDCKRFWDIAEKRLVSNLVKVEQGYAVDDKTERPTFSRK